MHEDLSRTEEIKPGSNRAFGWLFVSVFVVVAVGPALSGASIRWWGVLVAALLTGVTLAAPQLLAVPKRLWLRFGALLHRMVSPVVPAIMFYLVITPMGVVMRPMGKNSLQLRRSASCESYWIRREPPGPEPSSMSQQF